MEKAILSRRAIIDKSNQKLVIVVGLGIFVVVFSLIATKSLVSQAAYQNKIISKQRKAVDQLTTNKQKLQTLKSSYDGFVGSSKNVVDGLSEGSGPLDGRNDKIILDALPSYYDFPALTTNLEALVASQAVSLTSISGTDDQVAQSGNIVSGTPTPVAMPFDITVSADYNKMQELIRAFERSIRPMKLISFDISGSEKGLTANIKAETYYQPVKIFNVKEEVVK